MNTISRNHFLTRSLIGSIGLAIPALTFAQQAQDKPAPLNVDLVRDFVGASHSNLVKVKELLETEPHLLHASVDWGWGDFESGIEAAGHVGNKEIAAFLLSKGARYNIYLASMLGHLETVKNVLTFDPGLLNSLGPHGFTMLHHANKGGEEAKPVAGYLTSLGSKETRFNVYVKK
jgi:hypothetical protein